MRPRKIFIVARRDYLVTVRTKAFLFGLVIAPLVFGGGSIGMSFFRSKPDLKDRRIAIVDHTGAVAAIVVKAAAEKNAADRESPRYVFEAIAPSDNPKDQLLALSGRVRDKDLAAFLEIGRDVLRPGADGRVGYYTNAGGIDEMRSWLSGPVNDGIRLARLAQIGVDTARYPGLSSAAPIENLSLVERDAKTGEVQEARRRNPMEGFFLPFGVAMVLAMLVMVGSAPMLQNVTQDKSQRIVETLLGAATPLELMTGKVIGSVLLSVTSSLVYVVGGLVALQTLGMGSLLEPRIIVWFYVYLLADLTMLCAFAAAAGACCSTPQDAQNLALVILMPCILPMFMLVTVLRQPNGMFSTVMSLIPPFTPILMLLRQAMPNGIPAWQPWVGLAGVLIFACATVWAASRIFRVAILMQGKPPRLRELARLAMNR
jgi:ABC-2 type transport system permease protein